MNNSKVRIYELSRELNLDNKDILAVCERLNISVKSHSSTISESEAERIRKTAEKDRNSPGGVAHPRSDRDGGSSKEGKNLSAERKKQEILEIRRPKVRPGGNGKPSPDGEGGTLLPPPVAMMSQSSNNIDNPSAQNQSLEKPMLNRPVLSKQNQNSPEASTTPSEASKPLTPSSGGDLPSSPKGSVEETPSPTVSPKSSGQKSGGYSGRGGKGSGPVPKSLSSPPSRPSSSSSNKPVLKTARTEEGTEGAGSPVQKPQKPSRSKESGKEGSRDHHRGHSEGSEARPSRRDGGKGYGGRPTGDSQSNTPGRSLDFPRGGQGPKKQRPPAAIGPRSISPDIEPELEEDGEEIELENAEIPLLQRPIPRPTKKSPVWEDEDEESGEFPGKTAKVAAKAKARRVKPTIDDEEELEEVLDLVSPVVVSLSLARPAKPKSASKPTTVTGLTTGAKKKPTAPGSSTAHKQQGRRSVAETVKERPSQLLLSGSMTVQELADTLEVSETEIIKRLFGRGIAVNITQTLDPSVIQIVAQEMEIEIITPEKQAEATKVTEMLDEADLENLQRRPPVVTIMGHVDHGKTTLLDSIRKTKVAQGEAGGITQHIGAYHVDVEHDEKVQQVVFLDTPGHEAFTAMRARGARVTDIAILVVAADDGVQPQTIEAISHAKAAQVPIVVAINKIDKEQSQPDRVKQELTEYGLVAEEWGGETIMVPVSAIKGENLDTLLEMILLVAEMEDLSANPNRSAKGTVIEAHLDKARGPVATLLVQNGTLRVGDIIVAGSALGKVRAMIDDRGERVDEASPSFAVEILGLREVPRAGDEFDVFANEKDASAIANNRADVARAARLLQGRISLSGFSQQAKDGELKELNLILKADVQGSVEAIVGALRQLPQKEVQLRLLLAAPGEVTETDIDLAAASNAVILGFNTTFASGARQAADQLGVDVREYTIIYKLLDDVQGAMEGLLEPELVEEPLGQVEVRAIFPVGKSSVAGCYVLSGKAIRNCKLRIRRGSQVVHEGVLDSLKRMKDDIKEVNAGYECGILLDNFSDWREGDIIETYRMVTKRRTLSAN